MAEKHITKTGLKSLKFTRFTQRNVSLSELSTSEEDLETLKEIRDEKVKRLKVYKLHKEVFNNPNTYYLVLRSGLLFEIDDFDLEFKSETDETISLKNTVYTIFQDYANDDYIPADVHGLNHDDILNVIIKE